MDAKRHPMQAQRLRSLYAYEVLDTEREKDFDDIVKLAAAICGTAISVVNLIDDDRQWFKAEIGLGVRQTPLATSLCSHVILERDFTEISDTLLDPRMADNPLCLGSQGLRFYAGALLMSDDGLPIGTLCVLDYAPKTLTPFQRDALRVLSRQVMVQLEMRRALRKAHMLRQEVDHRVKNSLQSLSALTRLQAKSLTSPEAVAAINSVRSRLDAVSTLHELLYKTDADANVDLAAYMRTICDHAASLASSGVKVRIATDPVMVSSKQAVAVGTLLNECLANAFKHAFPDQRAGEINVTLSVGPTGLARILCSDNGVGSQPKANGAAVGIGFQIAEVACMELGCTLRIDQAPQGVSASFEFIPKIRTDVLID